MLRVMRTVLCSSALLLLCACGKLPAPTPKPPPFPLAIELPEALDKEKARFEKTLRDSVDAVCDFFRKRGFTVAPESLIDRAAIFESPEHARAFLAKRYGLPANKLPATFSGTVDGKTLLLIAPEDFEKIFHRIYPGYRHGAQTYKQLVMHELAHRAHALIAKSRFGTEDGMGPRWFFEGLALACAGQFPTAHAHLDWKTIAATIEADTKQKKGLRYPRYARLFTSLLASFPLSYLIGHAPDKDLVARLARDYLPSHFLLEHPQGRSKGTILLVHGSAPYNADGLIPIATSKSPYARHPFFADLSRLLRGMGWSVLRYHKYGVHWRGVHRQTYAQSDFAALSRQLRNLWRFMPDNKKRVVFAWGEGSLHVRALPLNEVDAAILLGGVSTNMAEVLEAKGGPTKKALLAQLAGKARTEMLGHDRPVGRMLDELELEDNWRVFARHPRLPLLLIYGDDDKVTRGKLRRGWRELRGKHRKVKSRTFPGRDRRLMPDGRYEVQTLAKEINRWLVLRPPPPQCDHSR